MCIRNRGYIDTTEDGDPHISNTTLLPQLQGKKKKLSVSLPLLRSLSCAVNEDCPALAETDPMLGKASMRWNRPRAAQNSFSFAHTFEKSRGALPRSGTGCDVSVDDVREEREAQMKAEKKILYDGQASGNSPLSDILSGTMGGIAQGKTDSERVVTPRERRKKEELTLSRVPANALLQWWWAIR